MQAEHREEAKEGLERDVLENREALGLVPAGQEEEGEEGQGEEEAVPPQVLKERIESVIEVLSEFQVRPVVPSESALVLAHPHGNSVRRGFNNEMITLYVCYCFLINYC